MWVDPIADHPYQIGISPYSAFWNNPIYWTDPTGLCPDCPDPSTAKEGDVVNPNGGMDFTFSGGEWTGDGGTLDEVTVTASRTENNANTGNGIGTAILDGVQTGLDVVGLIPGVGEIADGLNAAIYTGRGDYTNAALSAAAMIPFAGWAATGGKLGNKAYKAGISALPALDATGKVHGALPKVADFGNYSKDELQILHKELKQSVQKRIEITSKMGRDKAHGQRQGAEQDLIKSLEKYLGK